VRNCLAVQLDGEHRRRLLNRLGSGSEDEFFPEALQKGTAWLELRFCRMPEPLPILVESSLQIAWDFLDGLGEIADPQQTAEFLLRNIIAQILKGERRTLVLSNRAIDGYRQRLKPLQLVSC
jgi:hypothetical protein